jgi:2,5-dioxopentanoate dehydrogenase
MERTMEITGETLLGAAQVMGQGLPFRGVDPARGCDLDPLFYSATETEVAQACALAEAAFESYRHTTAAQRAAFLEAIAVNIVALGDALIVRAEVETGLPRARLEGERGRTVNQLRMFAAHLQDGAWMDARIDTALPERRPLPRPDLRMWSIPVGPVAVFGASNFPLAFSVAGGDTASALAAGCPVIVKGHPAHPGTGELVARAVQKAAADCRLPAGVFSFLPGGGNDLGAALVNHPVVQAVGFTGSRRGGLALAGIAARRSQPIPVYAEMSSINPMFLMPAALSARGSAIASGYVASLTLGAGQFCTNPGIVVGIAGGDFDRFCGEAAALLRGVSPMTMLSPAIHEAYQRGVAALDHHPQAALLARGKMGSGTCEAVATLHSVTATDLLADVALAEEIFGPASLLVACRDAREMLQVAQQLEGQLTASLHMDEADYDAAQRLLPVLERKAGRILVNGFPTGVEVADAMVHGGPFPATSDGRSTSVGTAAIQRFLRPVCYQDMPQALLPIALRDGNPLNIWHRRNGEITR